MNNLPVALAAGLEVTLNRFLGMDLETQEKLSALSGKVITIELVDLSLIFHLVPTENRLQVQGGFEGDADTILRGPSYAMVQMGLRDNASDSLFSGDVEIIGDVELGEQFRSILDGLDIDWEEQLSKVTGDIVAHQMGNTVRSFLQWGQKTSTTLQLDIAEYLQEESRATPAQDDVDGFINSVDLIRQDVDRFEARVHRLKENISDKLTVNK